MPVDSDEEFARRLGLAIAAARSHRKMSQEALAERLGIAKNFLGQLERAERSPSIEMLVRLARVLDISLDEVLLGRAALGRATTEAEALLASVGPDQMDLVVDILRAAVAHSAPSRHGDTTMSPARPGGSKAGGAGTQRGRPKGR
jgi:transcriptional regulator with XRE-family HTH domain